MNLSIAAVAAAFALGAGGVCAFLAFGPAQRTANAQVPGVQSSGPDVALLMDNVDKLTAEVAALRADAEISAAAPRTSLGTTVSDEAIGRAVAAYMASLGEGELEAGDLAAMAGDKPLGSMEDIALLLSDANDLSSVALWKRIVEEGRDEEVLAYFKALAEANPNDPEVQLTLGQAYLGRTQEAGASPLAGKYATLADQALDAALEADPEHWEARFTKATALSFWPPVFGKQAGAIAEFEHLVENQQGINAEPRHAQTHLLLGNMYHQTGQADKALAAWRRGLELFPDHSELAAQIAILER